MAVLGPFTYAELMEQQKHRALADGLVWHETNLSKGVPMAAPECPQDMFRTLQEDERRRLLREHADRVCNPPYIEGYGLNRYPVEPDKPVRWWREARYRMLRAWNVLCGREE